MPITVRQLEAIVRISESLARMQLKPVAGPEHVDEAIYLFNQATVDALKSGIHEGQVDTPLAWSQQHAHTAGWLLLIFSTSHGQCHVETCAAWHIANC